MDNFTIGLIINLIFISIFLIVVISISISRNLETKNFLESFDLSTLKKIEIKFMQSSSTNARVIGGNYIRANLYLNQDFIIITQKENSYFNSLYNRKFPIVITDDINKTFNIMNSPKIIVPRKLSITSWNAINIEFEEDRLLNIKYKITIRLENKNEIEYFRELKIENWC